MKTLILYSSTDGHTLEICKKLNEHLDSKADFVRLNEHTNIQLEDYERIIIGASIRYGKHRPAVADFILKNKESLKALDTVFFSVSLVARKENRNTPEQNKYLQKFYTQIDWEPNLSWVFAGKLNYPIYGFLDKAMIRFIMWMGKGPTDPSTIKVFTDWASVKKLAETINQQ